MIREATLPGMKTIRAIFAALARPCWFSSKPAHNPNPLNQPTLTLTPGGFIACQDAQPPFDTPVLVRVNCRFAPLPGTCELPRGPWRCTREAGHDGPCAAVPYENSEAVIGLGVRTRKISETHGQEEWRCVHLGAPGSSGAITHWKPI